MKKFALALIFGFLSLGLVACDGGMTQEDADRVVDEVAPR